LGGRGKRTGSLRGTHSLTEFGGGSSERKLLPPLREKKGLFFEKVQTFGKDGMQLLLEKKDLPSRGG